MLLGSMVFMLFKFLWLLVLLISPNLCYSYGGAISSSKVRTLPGFDGVLPFNLETGYIAVDDEQLFYYFIESERNPNEDPLMIWFSGGPGCSGFTGLVYEIGPLSFNIVEYNGSLPTLVLNSNSWTKVCNIIFLDSPVGAGFSYSTTPKGWNSGDRNAAKTAYIFLRKWLNYHPEFTKNPFYVGGDSYAGKVVTIVADEIANGIEEHHKPLINLEGYVLGNPTTDVNFDNNAWVQFSHRMSFVSDELYKLTKRNCRRDYVNVDPRNVECSKNLEDVSECIKMINREHVLEPKCVFVLPLLNGAQETRRSLEEKVESHISDGQLPKFGCRNYNYLLSYYWANNDSVQDALHVRKGRTKTWIRCKLGVLPYVKDIKSTIVYHLNLSNRGYRALIYSGDHDLMVPYVGTHAWIKSLNFSIIEKWRPWFVMQQVAGYTSSYSNRMTYATVKGAGHTAPEYKPKECFAMFNRWLHHNPL